MRQVLAATRTGVAAGVAADLLDAGDTDSSGAGYGADAWAETTGTRNELIALGWDKPRRVGPDADLATPPADLPLATATTDVRSWRGTAAPPARSRLERLAGAWTRPAGDGGVGHQHNEAAWKQRSPRPLIFLFPGPSAQAAP